ncbi:MAG: AAA family ATPase [Streptosporangiales bacterium]|nr:AAA family ATPase [Streptosporangiales bacterium]
MGARRPRRRRPLGVAPTLQRRQEEHGPPHQGAQLRRALRHDARAPRPDGAVRGTGAARRARRLERGVAALPARKAPVMSGHRHSPLHVEGTPTAGSVTILPVDSWEDHWTRIVIDDAARRRLENFALFSLTWRSRMSTVGLPSHGLLLLSGPPGTGKTTLAYGLANRTANVLKEREHADDALLVVVDLNAFPSEMLGATQRSLSQLFEETLPGLASRGRPVIVVLDEVEGLVVDRGRASYETNPIDVHRGTNAVLTGIDSIAKSSRNIVLIATTNDLGAVDPAFLSRVDVHEHIGLPTAAAIELMLADSFHEITGRPADGNGTLAELAERCATAGMDARQARKIILRAVINGTPELALAPDQLSIDDVSAAVHAELD